MKIGIIPLVSDVHDPAAVNAASAGILKAFEQTFEVMEIEARRAGEVDVPVVLIKTGGTEHKFKDIIPTLTESKKPVTLLSTDTNNSLPAAMEILAWLNRNNFKNSLLLHGPVEMLIQKLRTRASDIDILNRLRHTRLGVIGQPSDWLIASNVDYQKVSRRFGIQLKDIPLTEVIRLVSEVSGDEAFAAVGQLPVPEYSKVDETEILKAAKIYLALKTVINNHGLNAVTLRCFDLLGALDSTGCLALSKLNDEGIVAGCEGDIPAAFTMLIDQMITGKPSFMANPSRIDTRENLLTVAHCTVPFGIVDSFGYKTHFESGIGVGIAGRFDGKSTVTVSKIGGEELEFFYTAQGTLLPHQPSENLCRTQMTLSLKDDINYFLTSPLGNHHIFSSGGHAGRFKEVMALLGNRPV